MRLTVCHPQQLWRFRQFSGAWVYADTSFAEYQRVHRYLEKKAHVLCSPRQFQQVAIDSREAFVAWVDSNLESVIGTPLLLTPLSRNPFHGLFLHAVWIRFLAERIGSYGEEILVVTSSAGMARSLNQHCNERGISVQVVGALSYLLSVAKRNLRSIVKFGYQLFHALCCLTLSRLVLGLSYRRRLAGVDLLIDTFLLKDDVSPGGAVNHRYFPGLVDWYKKKGNRPAYYPSLFRVPVWRLVALYRGYARSPYLFCAPELFQRLSDLAFSVAECLIQGFRSTNMSHPVLFGANITPLVEGLKFQVAMDGLQPMLLVRTPKRLAESGIFPRYLLDWFENQPLDQATMIGFRQSIPTCQVIALHQYAFYSAILNFYVTTREVAEGIVPNSHWVCGNVWPKRVATYDRLGSYTVVPALRYGYLHRREIRDEDGSELLVLLTHSVDESVSVLALIGDMLPLLAQVFSGITIKTHPTLTLHRLHRAMGRNGRKVFRENSVRFKSSGLDELFGSARLVVSAGSGSALEAVAVGLPVLLVGRCAGIDVCPLEYVDQRIWKTIFDVTEFEAAICDWTPHHPLSRSERQEIGRKVMDGYFEPVTDEGMDRFVVS
jgi:hypothetical protein